MKEVLISIQPKWVEKIASGQKTIEVRKSRPKTEMPFKCYIYKTMGKRKDCFAREIQKYFNCGKVIGEFICDKIDNYECELWNDEAYELIRQFNYDEYGEIEYKHGAENNENCEMLNKGCLTWQDIRKYLGQGLNTCYAWHISNLKIYDKPKELSEFYTKCNIPENKCKLCDNCYDREDYYGRHYAVKKMTRPPQSWCYVEV